MNTQATSTEPVKTAGASAAFRKPNGAAFQDLLSQGQQPAGQAAAAADVGHGVAVPQGQELPSQTTADPASSPGAALSEPSLDQGPPAGAAKTKAQSKDSQSRETKAEDTISKPGVMDQTMPVGVVAPAILPASPVTPVPIRQTAQATMVAPASAGAASGNAPVHGTGEGKSEALQGGEMTGAQPTQAGATTAFAAQAVDGAAGSAATIPLPVEPQSASKSAGAKPAGLPDSRMVQVELAQPSTTLTGAAAASASSVRRTVSPGADAPAVILPAVAVDLSALASTQATLTPAAATVTTAAAAAAPATAANPAASASPASQLAPAMVQLANTAGSNHITIRLDPGELGSVAVRIDRADGGAATVQVTVDRPETLRMLQNDQPQLQRALDAAGLPQEGRTITLSLATPDQGNASGSTPSFSSGGSFSNSSGGSSSGGSNGGSGSQFGGSSGGSGGQPHGRSDPRYGQTTASYPGSTPSWLRAGVDITA